MSLSKAAAHIPRLRRDVSDLRTANAWAEHTLAAVLEYMLSIDTPTTIEAMVDTCERMTISTCFSGTGGPEVCAHGGARCMRSFLGRNLDVHLRCLWACDANADCRQELQLLPFGTPGCIFTDVTHALRPEVYTIWHLLLLP